MRRTDVGRLATRWSSCAALALLVACGGAPKPKPGPVGGAGTGAEKAPEPEVKKEAAQLFKEAAAAYKGKNLDEAIDLLEDAIEEQPDFGAAYFNIGRIQEEKGNLEEARTWYKRSAEKGKAFGDGLVNLGHLYLREGRENEAMAAFQRAIQVEPLNGEAHLNLALAAKKRRDFPAAVKHVRTALKEDSQNAKAYEVLAKVYYDLGAQKRDKGLYRLAELVCRQGLAIDPQSPVLHNTLGLVYLKLDDVTKALGAFEDAIKADPDFAAAHMNLGSLTFGYRDYETSYRAFDSVANLQPKNQEALLSKAVSARALGRLEEAETGYKKVLELDDKHVGAHFNLGVLYQEHMQKLEDAIKAYESVLRFSQDADLRKNASQRIKATRIQIKNLKEVEEMMRQQKMQEQKNQGGQGEAAGGAEG